MPAKRRINGKGACEASPQAKVAEGSKRRVTAEEIDANMAASGSGKRRKNSCGCPHEAQAKKFVGLAYFNGVDEETKNIRVVKGEHNAPDDHRGFEGRGTETIDGGVCSPSGLPFRRVRYEGFDPCQGADDSMADKRWKTAIEAMTTVHGTHRSNEPLLREFAKFRGVMPRTDVVYLSGSCSR